MTAAGAVRADQEAGPVLGESRTRVLSVLQDAGGPLSVGQVAERVALHANTARFHLDGLVRAGLAERSTEEREQVGRPRVMYSALPGSVPAGRRSYRLLAEVLTSYVAATVAKPASAATRAGQAWGRFLADRVPPFRRVDAQGAVKRLTGTLAEIGFEPEAVTVSRQRRILLHHCPFLEVAQAHREVVCSVHLGLMQGLLAGIDAPVETQRLDSFVQPNLCVAHLVSRQPRRDHRP